MLPHRLRVAAADLELLRRLTSTKLPKEGATFALAGVSRHEEGIDLLVRRAVELPEDAYDIREELQLEVATSAINGLASLCEANGLGGIFCHSHAVDVGYSRTDDDGEARLYRFLADVLPAGAPVGSLLFTPSGVQGRAWTKNGPVSLEEIVAVDRFIDRFPGGERYEIEDDVDVETFDRQLRVFGPAGQRRIAAAKVAVVGVGGTGSPTAEQLVRLGVLDILLIDDGAFERSNLTRMYGSFAETEEGREKVDLVAEHLRSIAPRARVRTIARNVVETEAALALRDREVVFLCTDSDWSRAVLNRFSHQYLVPVINMGVRFAPLADSLPVAHGAVDVLRPGLPCLWCKQSLSTKRISAESMPSGERGKRAREGYVDRLGSPALAVISATTTLSGLGVSLFLQLVTDFMAEGGEVSRLNVDFLDGTVRRGTTAVAAGCVCGEAKGCGDLRPLDTLDR